MQLLMGYSFHLFDSHFAQVCPILSPITPGFTNGVMKLNVLWLVILLVSTGVYPNLNRTDICPMDTIIQSAHGKISYEFDVTLPFI